MARISPPRPAPLPREADVSGLAEGDTDVALRNALALLLKTPANHVSAREVHHQVLVVLVKAALSSPLGA